MKLRLSRNTIAAVRNVSTGAFAESRILKFNEAGTSREAKHRRRVANPGNHGELSNGLTYSGLSLRRNQADGSQINHCKRWIFGSRDDQLTATAMEINRPCLPFLVVIPGSASGNSGGQHAVAG